MEDFNFINVTSLAEVWIEISEKSNSARKYSVTSLAEVWIEMERNPFRSSGGECVTSLAEVWIEIVHPPLYNSGMPSLPLRKCGLKF